MTIVVGLFVILSWAVSCCIKLGTGPIAIHLGLACARTTPRFPDFDHMPMAGKAATGKL